MVCTLCSHSLPVSPQVCPAANGEAAQQGHAGPGGDVEQEEEEQEEEVVDTQRIVLDDLTSVELAMLGGNGPGAIEPRSLSSPREMTQAQTAKHNISHLPRKPGCAMRRACTSQMQPISPITGTRG